MNKLLCIYFVGCIALLYWNAVILVQVGTKHLYVSVYTGVCYILNIQDIPVFSVLRRTEHNDFTSIDKDYTLTNCKNTFAGGEWELIERPIVGDHIHIGMVMSVNSHVFNFHDRNMSQPIPYEEDKYPVTCANPGEFAYEKRWYHTGVHTHCDGNIVHVHPWSSPNELRVEGRRVKLKLWFESVGIEVSPDKNGLKLPGSDTYLKNWNMMYYENASDKNPLFVTKSVEEMKNLWLVDHHALIVMWSGGDPAKKDLRVLDYESHPYNYPKRYN